MVTDRTQLGELSTVWRGAGHIAGAAAAIALVLPEPADERSRVVDQYDIGQATYAIMLAATDLGIGAGHSSVGDQDKARAILGVPDDHFVAYLIGLGYPAGRPLAPIAKPDRRPWTRWYTAVAGRRPATRQGAQARDIAPKQAGRTMAAAHLAADPPQVRRLAPRRGERGLTGTRGSRLTIIGGGVMGLMTAYYAAPLACSVTVLDKSRVGDPGTASFALTRSVRNDYLDPQYSRLAFEARQLWLDLQQRAGERLLAEALGREVPASMYAPVMELHPILGVAGAAAEANVLAAWNVAG